MKNPSALIVLLLSSYVLAQTPAEKLIAEDRNQIEDLIQETHLDGQLKAFELWESWASGTRGRPR